MTKNKYIKIKIYNKKPRIVRHIQEDISIISMILYCKVIDLIQTSFIATLRRSICPRKFLLDLKVLSVKNVDNSFNASRVSCRIIKYFECKKN